MKKILIILGIISLFPSLGFAQTIVKGTVMDEKKEPLIGVSVAEKGAANGTVTNVDGQYSISVSESSTLVFSYISYKSQEIAVNGRAEINVTLKEDAQQMDEVVVTAIGIKQQKKKLGYTTQQITADVLTENKTMNLGTALSGQIAGLTVTNPTGIFQSPSFSLRGKNPLIVIDGVPVESDFYDISANDVENINVLKGPTASALYGSRGKNGAILITSKNAQKEGLEISINTSNMITAGFTVFPETQTQYGNGSNGKYEFWDGADGGVSDGDMIWGPKLNSGVKIAQWNSPIRDKQTGQVIEWWGDVAGTQYDDKSRYERVPMDWVGYDNLKDFLGTGIITDNSFSVAYKGAKARYYVSGKYAYQKGQVPNTSLNTGGINFNSTFNLSNTLQLDASLSYNKVYTPNYPRYGYGPKNHMYTILIWMGNNVNGKELKEHMYVPGQEGYRQANWNYAWYNNPYFGTYELEQELDRGVTDGLMKLNWQILPNFSIQGRVSAREIKTQEDMKSPKSYMNYGDSRNGDYKMWNKTRLNIDADILASYSKSLSSNIIFSANAGGSSFYRREGEEYSSTDGLIVPYVYSLANTQGAVQAKNTSREKAIRSIYGSANFDFYDAVFLNLTARNDWSSTLPTSNNSYFYPSVSLSTMVSQYVKLPKAINYLKLYGSWAQVSSDLDPYSIYSVYEKGTTYGARPSVSYPSILINPNIKPEKSTSYEIGLSTAILQNKLSLDLTYYQIKDENQIIDLDISEASGFTSRKVNGNVYTTNGFEVIALFNALRNKNLSWDIAANWSTSVKKLTEIYGDQSRFGDLKAGDRADSYYATTWQRSASGDLIIDPTSGLPIKDPYMQNLGHVEPEWRLGLQNTFKIKDFRINIDIDGSWGGLIRSITVEKMWWGGKHPESVEFRDAEYAAGKPVYVPQGVNLTSGELKRDVNGNIISDTRAYANNTTTVSWQTWCQVYPYQAKVLDSEDKKFANIFDRSYFKLRRVSIGYDLAKKIDFGKIKSLDVSLFGYNLLMWKKVKYIDPDYGNDDNLQDPSSRYIGFSLNAKF